jgi:hypothetical protein
VSHDRTRPARRRRIRDGLRRHLPPLAFTATLAFVAAILALVLLARPANADARTIAESYDAGSARELELNLPFGEVIIEGVDGGPVRVRVEARCDGHRNCETFVESLRLESTRRGGSLRVSLQGPKDKDGWDFDEWGRHDGDDDADRDRRGGRRHRGHDGDLDIDVTVQVPRSLALDLNIGAGEVRISGLRRDLSIDMGAGELVVRMAEKAVRAVRVNLAVGAVQIHQGGRTREYARLVGGPVRWNGGKGPSEIDVNLGAGEVDVTLE